MIKNLTLSASLVRGQGRDGLITIRLVERMLNLGDVEPDWSNRWTRRHRR